MNISCYFELKLLFLSILSCHCWLPDITTKLINNKYLPGKTFKSTTNNNSDHFIVLYQDQASILIGGRNRVYNLSLNDFHERKENRIEWSSSDALGQLCILKGKGEDDCQNYIRVLYQPRQGHLVLCGTNSYKPMCKNYIYNNSTFIGQKEFNGVGLCPGNPEHNSTSVYHNDQLFSATVADLSGSDPLIYREPQRTELSDLKQLNAPNFVSSMPYDDYIFFFYRETAVEYMNCGKVIYSRVARVCKNDKGGPHQSRDRWTSFLKARLNCSIPGEYPFYFDEIQSTTNIIEGKYNSDKKMKILYGTLTTPNNAIGGSAICAYRMDDILRVFAGKFKHQENINSNWLPVADNMIPEPRPGKCVVDSRILPDKNFNFIKTHSLMEEAVPALFGKPILIRVSLHYRFTSIAVDPQIQSIDNQYYDVIYIGTDDGKVFKSVNIPNEIDGSAKAVVISENNVLPHGMNVKEIKLANGYGKIVVVGSTQARLVSLNHCMAKTRCWDCVELQDPHCAWDVKKGSCVSIDNATSYRFLIQDIAKGDKTKCQQFEADHVHIIANTISNSNVNPNENNLEKEKDLDNFIGQQIDVNSVEIGSIENENDSECNDGNNIDNNTTCTVKQQLVIYTAGTLHIVVVIVSIVGLVLGFLTGYWFSKRYHLSTPPYPDAPFIEQHNHLDRMGPNSTGYLTPRLNKSVNLVLNVSSGTPTPKKDNLDVGKDLNIASDGTLQKIKKTYI